jgi:uncharacterized protein YukE
MSNQPVRTDYEYIDSVLNNLQSRINTSRGIYSEKANMNNVSEGNMLYQNMNKIMNGYYDAQNELLDKLNREAEAIRQAAKMYQDLNKNLEKNTEGLDSFKL